MLVIILRGEKKYCCDFLHELLQQPAFKTLFYASLSPPPPPFHIFTSVSRLIFLFIFYFLFLLKNMRIIKIIFFFFSGKNQCFFWLVYCHVFPKLSTKDDGTKTQFLPGYCASGHVHCFTSTFFLFIFV